MTEPTTPHPPQPHVQPASGTPPETDAQNTLATTPQTTYAWRGDFANPEVNVLHAQGFDHPPLDIDWHTQVHRHSLGWVCARRGDELVGFVNVAWDGGVHAFVLDTVVAEGARRTGVGTRLVAAAVEGTRAAGCEWLHVDFDDHLRAFYFDGCGFTPTDAGLIAL
ncbi:GNAT family N-acetyltransferase [Streptomyces buecherae]|uniref:GNAT family N-acetyltransferase n=1 Tax=Streptomyces buecherae TaxID=2763006 RepID=A0A7H8NBR5_9ACTN|nr:GNAT family N-acetyltransferase [Streptomyces buecherae]